LHVFAEVIEVTDVNTPEKALGAFEFAIVNFYDNGIKSMESRDIYHLAEQIFTNKVRTDAVGWGELDVKKYP
jgi:hypothetical protein